MWLAPPVMNSRMQLLCLGRPADCSAARAARVLSQPEAGAPRAPAAVRRSQSRRETRSINIIRFLRLATRLRRVANQSVVEQELRAVEQRPEHVAPGAARVLVHGGVPGDAPPLVGGRPARQPPEGQ